MIRRATRQEAGRGAHVVVGHQNAVAGGGRDCWSSRLAGSPCADHVSTYAYPASGPPAYAQPYWFGMLTAPGVVDVSQGFLMPYLEGRRAVPQCPDFNQGDFQRPVQGATGGYGFSYRYLGAGPKCRRGAWFLGAASDARLLCEAFGP